MRKGLLESLAGNHFKILNWLILSLFSVTGLYLMLLIGTIAYGSHVSIAVMATFLVFFITLMVTLIKRETSVIIVSLMTDAYLRDGLESAITYYVSFHSAMNAIPVMFLPGIRAMHNFFESETNAWGYTIVSTSNDPGLAASEILEIMDRVMAPEVMKQSVLSGMKNAINDNWRGE